MSYQGGNQGYGQQNPYGQSGNPYSDQGNPYSDNSYPQRPQAGPPQGSSYYNDPEQGNGGYGRQGGYGQQQGGYGQQQGGYGQQQGGYGQQQGGYEMSNMNGNDPNRVLNETRDIDRAIDDVERDLERLKMLQTRMVDATDGNNASLTSEIDNFSDNTIQKYRGLTTRVNKLRGDPESGNPRNSAQVGKVHRRLKTLINKFQQQDSEYRRKLNERMAREYRIVRPDASDAEVREATEDPNNTQIFSQALINSDRRGQAQSAAQNVRSRHDAIQKIERDMIILAQLFQDLEAAVIQQEAAVTKIEEQGEQVTQNVAVANTELDGAVKKARAARRKKWWCFGIVVLILIIIAVVVAVAVTVTTHH